MTLTGEIDVLVADPDRSRLRVCEVKDRAFAFSPSTVGTHASRFLKHGRHIDQLLRNAREVGTDKAGWARFLGVLEPDHDWRVLLLMVTRYVEPAAFTSDPAVPFEVLEDLAALLQAASIPDRGYVWPHDDASQPPNFSATLDVADVMSHVSGMPMILKAPHRFGQRCSHQAGSGRDRRQGRRSR
jgi:hypothetical protein